MTGITHIIKSFITIGIIMGALDYLYLSSIGDMFKKMIYRIQGSCNPALKLKPIPTILCYFLLIYSIQYFIIGKNLNNNMNNNMNNKNRNIRWIEIESSILDAFILGFSIYGIYELTNYATIPGWSMELVIIDTLWGGILFSLTTMLYYMIISKI